MAGQGSFHVGGGSGAFSPLSLAPQAWWRFDDGSGTTAVDSSGHGYDLTLTNTPTWVAGQVGGAMHVAAASSEYGQTTAAGLRTALQDGTGFTIACLVRASATAGNHAVISISNGADAGNLVILYCYDGGSGGGTRVYLNNASLDGAEVLAFDTWNSVVLVSRGPTDHELFVNNVSVATSTDSRDISTVAEVSVGGWVAGSQFFTGDVDEVMLLDRALTAGEMAALFAWTGL